MTGHTVKIDDARSALVRLQDLSRKCICDDERKKAAHALSQYIIDSQDIPRMVDQMGVLRKITSECRCVPPDLRTLYADEATNILRIFLLESRSKACPEYHRRAKSNGGYYAVYVDKKRGLYEPVSEEPYVTRAEAERFSSETSKLIRNLKKQCIEVQAMSAAELEVYR